MILISNKKYKKVLKERNLYQKYYYDEQRLTGALRCEIATLKDEIKEYRDSNEYIINMVDDFKRKYLDEQQKRLFLAELIKKLEGDENGKQ
jgi:predicted nucleotide-binding protein (sugar kinase/HSP70/actin superfamily)